MKAYINAIGLQANGLEGWTNSQTILTAQQPYQAKPLSKYSPLFLPANERRRATSTIKLALRTAEETLQNADKQTKPVPTLFACVDGDTEISAKMTSAILMDEPMVSPIHFHNSVHNAPAGYWMIGQKNQQAASAISAGEYQIATLFLEAMSQLSKEQPEILLIAYDLPIDPVIESITQPRNPFAFGLLLSLYASSQNIAEINTKIINKSITTRSISDWFGDNQAAQFLPVLKALAKKQHYVIEFALSKTLSHQLTVKYSGRNILKNMTHFN